MRTAPRLAAVFALALMLGGCFNPFRPNLAPDGGIPEPPPTPSSAVGVLQLFEWCWDHRNLPTYRELFTEDFRFQFALGDSAGNAFQGRATNRDEELAIATNLFVGGGDSSAPPANRIALEWLQPLRATNDTRPGKRAPWHQEIPTAFRLDIDTDGEDFTLTGISRFFLVRGDSALLPQELLDLGFTRDSTRWFIEEWHDETEPLDGMTGGGGLAARPAGVSAAPFTITGAWRRCDGATAWRAVAPGSATFDELQTITLGQLKQIWR